MAKESVAADVLDWLVPYYTWAMPYTTLAKWLTCNEGTVSSI